MVQQVQEVSLLLRKNLNYKVNNTIMDRRVVIIDIQNKEGMDEDKLVLCNIYAPNIDSPEFFYGCN